MQGLHWIRTRWSARAETSERMLRPLMQVAWLCILISTLTTIPLSHHHLCGRPLAEAQPTTPRVTISNLHTDPYSSCYHNPKLWYAIPGTPPESLPEKLGGQLSRYESLISLHSPLFSKTNPLVSLPARQQIACCDYSSTSVLVPRGLTDPSRHLAFFSPVETFRTSTSLVHP